MSSRLLTVASACIAALFFTGSQGATLTAQGGATGTISGHIRLMSAAPTNPIVRMGADPQCSRAAGGKRLTQDIVLRSADGGLANAFVNVQGTFPPTPAPAQPVALNQQACMFTPRVVGARIGQTLQITNSDATAHNLHALSTKGNDFNTSQPLKGMVYKFPLKANDVMMRVKCDIHSWMIAYVGVVANPYFAVSAADGAFTIARVPAGRHTIQVWHEQYGRLMQTVEVKAGQTAAVDFSYTGKEKPSVAGLQELVIPADVTAVTLLASMGTR